MPQIARIGKLPAEVSNAIELNDTDGAIASARFNYETKLFSLQQEFNSRRDSLRHEYHGQLAEITAAE